MKAKIFRWNVSVKGNLVSNYVFENLMDIDDWLNNELPKLEKKYGILTYNIRALAGLRIGDECHVSGDGDEVYVIEGQVKYSPNRYGFMMNSGITEEVYKCGRV